MSGPSLRYAHRSIVLKALLTLSLQVVEETPSKYVCTPHRLQLQCSFLLIDLEGKADGRALKTIIPQINPKAAVSFSRSLPCSAAPDIVPADILRRLNVQRDRPRRRLRGHPVFHQECLRAVQWSFV